MYLALYLETPGPGSSVDRGTHGLRLPSTILYGRPHGSLSSPVLSSLLARPLASAIASLRAFIAAPHSRRAPSISSTVARRLLRARRSGRRNLATIIRIGEISALHQYAEPILTGVTPGIEALHVITYHNLNVRLSLNLTLKYENHRA